MSISSNYPLLRPSLLLDFAQVGRLDPRVQFTRASSATYYDGVTTAKAEENLLVQSQDFSTSWSVNAGLTVTANTETAPDGTITADTLSGDGTSSVKRISRNVTPNGACVFSCFVKKGTNNFIQLYFDGSSFANFDIDTGVVGSTGGTVTSSIVNVGNGWYRCIAVNSSTTVTFCAINLISSSSAARAEVTTLSTDVFLWGAQVEQRSAVTAYTPTTTQPITNYIPVLQTAAAGVPRFDHNPTTGEALGLLIEEQRANLCLQSEDLGTTWTASSSSVTTNTIVAPDGTLTGDKLIVDSGTSLTGAFASQSITKAAVATTYTLSVYYKAGEYNQAQLLVRETADGANSANVRFNALTGEIVSAAAATGTFTSASASAGEPVGNGWFRFALTFTTGTETSIRIQLYSRDSTAITGDGYSGIYIWGADLEAGAFPTSYIPTTSASATRNADAASMTGTNFSSWYNAGEGTFYIDWRRDTTSGVATGGGNSVPRIFSIGTSNAGSFQLRLFGATNSEVVGPSTYMASNWAASQYNQHAIAYEVDNNAVVYDGGSAATDTSSTAVTGVDMFSLGQNTPGIGNAGQLFIKKFAYYPQRLTDAQLQALTG